MAGEKLFIVEDERIVAEDLKRMLERLGYQVVGTAASGEKAIQGIESTHPNLVLMDIHLQGAMDGTDVAEHVFAQLNIPVIYLTAYADEITVDKAKGTLALGYILKPFEERGLKTTIELALHRHTMDKMLKNVDEWHGGILDHLPVAVMAVDSMGRITYMNKNAEELTGSVLPKVIGKKVEDLVLAKKTGSGVVPSQLLVEREGRRVVVDCTGSAVNDQDGNLMGTALMLVESKASPDIFPPAALKT